MKNILIGLTLAASTIAIHQMLDPHQGLELTSLLLVLIGSVYFGFALMSKETKTILLEVSVASVFVSMAVLGLWLSPWIIIAGLFLHGIWDVIHHRSNSILARVPKWYIPFCATYDWAMALYLVLVIKGFA